MKKLALILIMILIAAPAVAADKSNSHKKSVYERVKESGKIRCAYYTWPPYISKNLKTGQLEGFSYDMTEAVAKSLNLEVEWTVELNPGDQVTALQSGKADALCAIDGPFKPHTSKDLIYSDPPVLVPLYVYARTEDRRFDQDMAKADSPDVKFSVIDGDIVHDLAKAYFPRAQHMALQLLGAPGQMMQDVIAKKADLLINDELTMEAFMKSNPGTLRRIGNAPLAVIPLTFSVLRADDSYAFADMINQALKNLTIFGESDKVIKRYDPNGTFFYRPAKPYEVPK